MNFISWAFLVCFVPLFFYRYVLGRHKTEWHMKLLVMAFSTFFIVYHVPIYIFVLLATVLTDYLAAVYIGRESTSETRRRVFLVASISINLLILGFFKYTDFAAFTAERVGAVFGHSLELPRLGLALPIAISFYTFCSLSYTIDVYRRQLAPVRGFSDYYYFVSFFPHLVAGPIIRAEQFLYQLHRRRRPCLKVFNAGAYLVIRGLFLKMVCADRIAAYITPLWISESLVDMSALNLFCLAVFFSVQILCDFEGYTSIARGLAYWMGFRFPINFNNPYIARSFSEFWERWHITLSSWIRDYLYVPLGGNRKGKLTTYRNLLIVMFLGGLWHGAGLTFLVWGLIHGAALAVERLLGLNRLGKETPFWVKGLWFLVVQTGVLIGWVFFRSRSISEALVLLKGVFSIQSGVFHPFPVILFAVVGVVGVMHVYGYLQEKGVVRSLHAWERAALAGLLVCVTLTCYGLNHDFIYFQF